MVGGYFWNVGDWKHLEWWTRVTSESMDTSVRMDTSERMVTPGMLEIGNTWKGGQAKLLKGWIVFGNWI